MIKRLQGFTLIELIVVIGIIAILAAIVIVAINPTRQFAQARNTQRESDVLQILNAVYQYAAENNGDVPTTIITTEKSVCNTGSGATCSDAVTFADLSTSLVPTYVSGIPKDPRSATTSPPDTKYAIVKGDGATAQPDGAVIPSGRIRVRALSAELGATIAVTR